MSTTATTAPAKAALPNEGRPGYKHTKLGWIPEEWEVKSLKKIVRPDRKVRYGIVQAGEHLPEGIPCLRVVDLATDYVDLNSLYRTSQKISDQYKDCILQVGDIVFALRGEIGKLLLVDDRIAGINITRGVARISPRATIQPEYLFYQLQAYGVARRIDLEVNGTSLKEVPIGGLNRVEVAYPKNLPEQRRIAAVLGAWDRAIATAQQLLAAQQERKRGLMQELLTGKRRFPGFRGKWKECELGELGQFRTSSVDKKLVDGQQRVRLVNYMDVYNNQRIHSGMPFMEVTAKDSQLQTSSLRRGDILFTPSSETPDDIGHSAVVVEDMVNTLFSYHVMRFRPHDDTLDLDFRAYVFNNERILKQFSAKATGSTRYTLSASDFGDTLVSFPTDKSEQQAIARTLMACDSEIEAITNQLAHLTTQKQGLMQQLLTGAVRVKC